MNNFLHGCQIVSGIDICFGQNLIKTDQCSVRNVILVQTQVWATQFTTDRREKEKIIKILLSSSCPDFRSPAC